MKSKALIIGSVLAASLLVGTTAQADDDVYYNDSFPYFIGGLWLGLALDHDHYRDHGWYDYRYRHHPYPREYRRSYSHGFQHSDKYRYDRGHDKYRHDNGRDKYRHDRDRWDRN
jgi:hypothetical protein